MNWIKVDFANWRDEDESEEEDDKTRDLEKMMSQMGGGGFGGMGKLNFRKSLVRCFMTRGTS